MYRFYDISTKFMIFFVPSCAYDLSPLSSACLVNCALFSLVVLDHVSTVLAYQGVGESTWAGRIVAYFRHDTTSYPILFVPSTRHKCSCSYVFSKQIIPAVRHFYGASHTLFVVVGAILHRKIEGRDAMGG